jgi:hypothetical protein
MFLIRFELTAKAAIAGGLSVDVVEGNRSPRDLCRRAGFDRRTALLLHELLLGRSECLQIRYATETLDLIQEIIEHDLQALIFRCQLSDRAMQG